MYAALLALIFLIDVTPAMLIINDEYGTLFSGFVSVIAAFAIVVIAVNLHYREGDYLRSLFRPIVVLAALPIAWMVIQNLPLPNLNWAHPVWQSAAAAIGESLVGSLSIDRGVTFIALGNYLLTMAILFIAAAVGIDRQRAEGALVALIGATTLIAILVIIQDLIGIKILGEVNYAAVHDNAIDGVALGTILSAAMIGRTLDQHHRRSKKVVLGSVSSILVATLLAFAVCTLTLIFFGTIHVLVAAAFGLATLLSVVAMRRFGLGLWGGAGIATVVAVAIVAMIALQPRVEQYDLTLAFASAAAPQSLVSLTQRIMGEGSWAGSGAGTFRALVPIYKDVNDLVDGISIAPTAAAAMVVEFGRPAFWLAVITAIVAILALLRGAISRGRDSSFPAAAAGCLVAATLLAFNNAGIFSTATSIIVATAVGLGFSQSKSRTIG